MFTMYKENSDANVSENINWIDTIETDDDVKRRFTLIKWLSSYVPVKPYYNCLLKKADFSIKTSNK